MQVSAGRFDAGEIPDRRSPVSLTINVLCTFAGLQNFVSDEKEWGLRIDIHQVDVDEARHVTAGKAFAMPVFADRRQSWR
jgi:hypothetical protein